MAAAEQGNIVQVHYSGFLDDGTLFDSSLEREPLEFTVGEGMVIPGFEAAVVGMEAGGTKTVAIPPAEAYGERDEEMVAVIERSRVADDLDPHPGALLQLSSPEGGDAQVTVLEVTDATITLDGNHPLAGKELIFELKLVSIR
ncbi:MAG: peptidylprolyl isomerase [Nitrospirae bacterium CG18_big_fil_WC_8_21_14_2_50_70_55]|nr:peptidylprolyl isomerase [Deltaproteobacteria bacterium]OIP62950.1 MAG: peptidylprolyl isomerase [Nitrospirae bacterium CG2_30_70_394]PIQ05705.1 MAG: peptidylprolyl isomerase [Nitrospirae bacterium CG18_big_fil_WC_8_21_14_2_50_70_55]PIU79518.1 MAG: peptidylprolyl isomerase [Nitrospirae bacterium CG06_land_8_20_14_3_00_70_43]PIW83810.1 MAG: peptidylprolyl isomerase [Nitrospirae bacterium CG_4_8_14_3_um_filter_70_85]PIX82209.1 MAG: peptidylprolyl isomerase [Nitrospirae bacterium CG_4_10_14_3_